MKKNFILLSTKIQGSGVFTQKFIKDIAQEFGENKLPFIAITEQNVQLINDEKLAANIDILIIPDKYAMPEWLAEELEMKIGEVDEIFVLLHGDYAVRSLNLIEKKCYNKLDKLFLGISAHTVDFPLGKGLEKIAQGLSSGKSDLIPQGVSILIDKLNFIDGSQRVLGKELLKKHVNIFNDLYNSDEKWKQNINKRFDYKKIISKYPEIGRLETKLLDVVKNNSGSPND